MLKYAILLGTAGTVLIFICRYAIPLVTARTIYNNQKVDTLLLITAITILKFIRG